MTHTVLLLHVSSCCTRLHHSAPLLPAQPLYREGSGCHCSQAAEHATPCCRGLDTDSGVRYWTDYLKMHLHLRSTCLLPGWQDGASPQGFGEGAAGLESSETREAALDRVRFWAEECDTLQVSLDRSERAARSFRMSAAAWRRVVHGAGEYVQAGLTDCGRAASMWLLSRGISSVAATLLVPGRTRQLPQGAEW